MSVEWPWSELGLERDADERAVKRAYATRLKAIDRSDAAQFEALRRAYETARASTAGPAKSRARPSIASLIKADSESDIAASLEDAVRNRLRQEQASRDGASEASSDEPAHLEGPAKRGAEPPDKRAHLDGPAERQEAPSQEAERPTEPQLPGKEQGRPIRLAPAEPASRNDAFADRESVLIQILAAIEARDPARLKASIAQTDDWDIDATRRLEADIIRFCTLDTERVTREVAAVLDARFGWAADAARLRSLCRTSPESVALLEKLLAVLPRPAKVKAQRGPRPPIELDGLTSLSAFFISIGNGIHQGVTSDGFILNFIISAVATFFLIALGTVIFQTLLRVLGWTRKLGAERLFQALAGRLPRVLRNVEYGELGAGFVFSITLSQVIALIFLFFGETLLGKV